MQHLARRAVVRLLLPVAVLGVWGTVATPSATALDDVTCPPWVESDGQAVPGGDAALAGRQPGPAPATQPGRCWFTPITLSILLPEAVATGPVVVVADGSGQAVALSAADGTEAWTYRVADEGEGQVHGLAAGPSVVYVAGPAGVTALDAADGTRVWRHRVSSDGALLDASGSFGPIAHADAVYAIDSSTQDDATFDRRLVALDASTGDVRWEAPLPGLAALPPVTDGTIIATAPGDGTLLAFTASTGQPAWTADMSVLAGAAVTRPAIGAGVVVEGLGDGSIVALGASTGAVTWRYPGEGLSLTSVSIDGGTVLVNAATTLTALDAGTGSVVWNAPLQASAPVFPFTSLPAVSDDLLIVGTTDSMEVASLIALAPDTGTERWRVATDAYGALVSPLVSGGRVVVPVQDITGSGGLLSLGVAAQPKVKQ